MLCFFVCVFVLNVCLFDIFLFHLRFLFLFAFSFFPCVSQLFLLAVSFLLHVFEPSRPPYVCIGNSMICSDIWLKYLERYFKTVIRNFTSY